MKNLKTSSTTELLVDVQLMERQIEMLIHQHNIILEELYNRIPNLRNEKEFQPKFLMEGDMNDTSKNNEFQR